MMAPSSYRQRRHGNPHLVYTSLATEEEIVRVVFTTPHSVASFDVRFFNFERPLLGIWDVAKGSKAAQGVTQLPVR